MKSFLHCHVRNLHSISLGLNDKGNLVRIFIAENNHNLNNLPTSYIDGVSNLALHGHKTDITIYPIYGRIYNTLVNPEGRYVSLDLYEYYTAIADKGKFVNTHTTEVLPLVCERITSPVFLGHGELHSISVTTRTAAWIVVEGNQVEKDTHISYSTNDLTLWTPDRLYEPMDEVTKHYLLRKHLIGILRKDNPQWITSTPY